MTRSQYKLCNFIVIVIDIYVIYVQRARGAQRNPGAAAAAAHPGVRAAARDAPDRRNAIGMGSTYTGEHGKDFLHAQIKALLGFYDPIVRDDDLGGFNNQLRDDGTVYDKNTKHAVGTARYTVNYALASMLYSEPAHKDLCAHGVKFLMEKQLDHEHGGFAWVLNGHTVQDGDKWCYSVAFSLLALANAHRAGVEGAAAHIATVHALAEEKYYESAHGLYVDSYPRDFSFPATYRGQNANMHMCEAQVR
jgi:mannose/cellobiose epimerase-like protein (N-acyl-D-glucosamine 2-epimerase family)